ncbi:MAG: radical SAM protein [Candidatus Woesearchaeota archaeon]|nr:radical SAM protein [Candidatus Woesearchaeota archaeon]
MEGYISDIVVKKDLCTVNFAGCDFKCPFCSKAELVNFDKRFLNDLKIIKKDIKASKSGYVVFSGGEPCLQKDALIELMSFCKKLNKKNILETNGSNPDVILELINKKLADVIKLDIKAPLIESIFENATRSNTFFKKTKEIIENIKKTLRILKENESKVDVEIRTTIVPSLIYKKEDIAKIGDEIKEINCMWRLQQFSSDDKTVDPKFENIKSPSKEFLENLKAYCLKKNPNLRIEV